MNHTHVSWTHLRYSSPGPRSKTAPKSGAFFLFSRRVATGRPLPHCGSVRCGGWRADGSGNWQGGVVLKRWTQLRQGGVIAVMSFQERVMVQPRQGTGSLIAQLGHLTKEKISHLANGEIPQMADVPG